MSLLLFFRNGGDKKYLFILFLSFCLSQAVLYERYQGLAFSGDSAAYIRYAQLLANGVWEDNFRAIYLGYLLFLATFFKLGFGLKGIIFVQIALSGAAAYYHYLTIKRLAHNAFSAFAGTFLFITWPSLLTWNLFVLTDSLFTSFLIFSLYRVVTITTAKDHVVTLLCLFTTTLIRPNGFIVLSGYTLYLISARFARHKQIGRRLLTLAVAGIIFIGFTLTIDLYLLRNFNFLKTYESGQVIFNSPYFSFRPEQVMMPPPDFTRLQQLLYFIQNNPAYFVEMAAIKCLLFFGHVKPYYSVLHNLFIVLLLYPGYYFAIKGLAYNLIPRPVKWFLASVVLQQGLIITLTSEDWDGRFLMSVISYIFVLAIIGLQQTLKMKPLKSLSDTL